MNKIDCFDKEYAFLSNFYDAPVYISGFKFKNSEAAFQAMKTTDLNQRAKFCDLPPNKAKRLGRQITLRPDWEEIKDEIMYQVVFAKFSQNIDLRLKLIATGECELIEGNYWHDNTWGDCSCDKCANIVGENRLGRILMRVREDVKKLCL